jgi:hypothetical protein
VVRVMPNLPCLVGATAAGALVSISFLISRCTHFLSIPICAAVRFGYCLIFLLCFYMIKSQSLVRATCNPGLYIAKVVTCIVVISG